MMKGTVALLAVAASACASTSAERPFRDMAGTVEQRSGHRLHWDDGSAEDAEVTRSVRALLKGDLSLAGAVQVALLQNPGLRATFEDLGIAQAALVQAGLLKNPTFSLGATVAEADRLDPNLVFGLAQDFLDLFMIPARKKLAGAELEAAKLRVGDAALELAANVRAAYFEVESAQQVLAMRRMVADASQASRDLARRQSEAGNIGDLSLSNEEATYQQMKLDVARAEADVLSTREKLTRLMGVFGPDLGWRITAQLPDVPAVEVPFDRLESLAIAQRLDLASLRGEAQATAYALGVIRSTRWTPGISASVEVARLTSGVVAFGPSVSLELPLFDQKQAVVARLEAMLRQALHRAAEKAIAIRSEVRSARDRVVYTRRVALHYKTTLVPLREKIVRLSQEEYDAMLLGVYQLLQAKQSEVSTYREYIESVRDYWLARSDLERAVGGRLGVGVEATTPAPPPPASSKPPPSNGMPDMPGMNHDH